MDKRYFFRCGDNVFRFIKSDGGFSTRIYDFKSHMWVSADIVGKTVKECKEICTYVYDGVPDEDINITFDYVGYEEEEEDNDY